MHHQSRYVLNGCCVLFLFTRERHSVTGVQNYGRSTRLLVDAINDLVQFRLLVLGGLLRAGERSDWNNSFVFPCAMSLLCFQVVSIWRNRSTTFAYAPPLLSPSADQLFNASNTLIEILEEGMIEELTIQASYNLFFDLCAASNCTYSLKGREDLVIIATRLLGIFSGLSVILRLVTPFLFHIVYWPFRHAQGKSLVRVLHIRGRFVAPIRPCGSGWTDWTRACPARALELLQPSPIIAGNTAYRATNNTPVHSHLAVRLHHSFALQLRCRRNDDVRDRRADQSDVRRTGRRAQIVALLSL